MQQTLRNLNVLRWGSHIEHNGRGTRKVLHEHDGDVVSRSDGLYAVSFTTFQDTMFYNNVVFELFRYKRYFSNTKIQICSRINNKYLSCRRETALQRGSVLGGWWMMAWVSNRARPCDCCIILKSGSYTNAV